MFAEWEMQNCANIWCSLKSLLNVPNENSHVHVESLVFGRFVSFDLCCKLPFLPGLHSCSFPLRGLAGHDPPLPLIIPLADLCQW